MMLSFTQRFWLYAIPLLLVLLIYITFKKGVANEQKYYKVGIKRTIILVLRFLTLTSILIAAAGPVIETGESIQQVPKVKVLVDTSRSMELYDIEPILQQLDSMNIPATTIQAQEYMPLGDSILSHLEPQTNLLLISDGQSHSGTSIEDAMLVASGMESKIYALDLQSQKDEALIRIQGPSKVVADVENEFIISLDEIGDPGPNEVSISIDDEIVFEGRYKEPIIILRSFHEGSHTMVAAVVPDEDHFSRNNIYYKSIQVLSRPDVLLVGDSRSPLQELYQDFYDLDQMTQLPDDIEDYHAIILNDVNGEDIDDDIFELLENYVLEGNGLMVVGGRNSYDRGEYNTSLLANLLPVGIGEAAKKKDIINVVVVMDTGASSIEDISDGVSLFDVQKSLAADIIRSMKSSNNVGFVEANYYLNVLSQLSELGPKRNEMIKDISLLAPGGFSELRFAYKNAHEMLRLNRGSKNIVIITDGKLVPADQALTLEYVRQAANDGIKTYIIGVGDAADEDFLLNVKNAGRGEYFRAYESDRLKLYFGDPEDTEGDYEAFIYDSNHFITRELDELGEVFGFNAVYPKANARMLVTTTSGDPLLTIWNYGLGRVAALSSDDASRWMSGIMPQGSAFYIRTLNYAIGDPQRKQDLIVTVPELHRNSNAQIIVEAALPPLVEGLNFEERQQGLFAAQFYPTDVGFKQLLVPIAVNYEKEISQLGMSKQLEKQLAIAGGSYLPLDSKQIEDHILAYGSTTRNVTEDLSWYAIAAAIVIFLLELFIRRIYQSRLPH